MIDFSKYKLVDSRIGIVITDWYLSHTNRDQTVIKFVTILVLLTFIWAIIFQPLLNWHAQQKSTERLMYSLLTTIKNNTNKLVQSKSDFNGTSTTNTAIIPIITRTANLNKIKLSRLQPESDDAVVVYLEDQRFSSVLRWILQLRENNMISIRSANIESEEVDGMIAAQLSFTR
ncbi:MAG: type II secretion system protein GspM [Candidatus Azotimanducaceae bacterium]